MAPRSGRRAPHGVLRDAQLRAGRSPALLVVAAALPLCGAHKSLVCTATARSKPNMFTFFICTYHPNPVKAHTYPCSKPGCLPRCPEVVGATGPCCTAPPAKDQVCGELHIHEHDGDRSSNAGTWCTLQNQVGGSNPASPTEDDAADPGMWAHNITVAAIQANMLDSTFDGRCSRRGILDPRDNKTLLKLMEPDSELSCYHHNRGNNPEYWGTAVIGNSGGPETASDFAVEHIGCTGPAGGMTGIPAYMKPIKTCYAIIITDVKAGTYYAYTDGTDENLEPSRKLNGQTPCGMQSTEPYYFDISVADGGADCRTQPVVEPNTDPASVANCDGSTAPRFSGFICSVVCLKGFRRVGNLQCSNGQWTAYECTNRPVCLPPGEPGANNNNTIPGNNGTMYIQQVFDGWPGPGSVPTRPGCGLVTKADTICNYTCNTDPDPYCTPSRAVPRVNFPVGFRQTPVVRSSIRCESDGRWYPGPDYCGCMSSPCVTPTPTFTPTFSRSFSGTPSGSNTFSPTFTRTFYSPTWTPTTSPTLSVTPVPFCVFGEPISSTLCVEADIAVWWPWLLLLILPLICCLLALCMLCRRPGPGPGGLQLGYLPAVDDAEDIDVRVAKPEEPPAVLPPPPAPDVQVQVQPVPDDTVNVTLRPVAAAGVQVRVSSVAPGGVQVRVSDADALPVGATPPGGAPGGAAAVDASAPGGVPGAPGGGAPAASGRFG
eukprot:TRINITY_DN16976_c0_g1_i1.p1 TRINITY_DN16976_c0_g1~~TRINITY_DN16976_c0_g1_i1.p1  ORF type:complete len:737 (+),score=111.95 TRINITY_DN16976_c0_g1_i1:70-2211(+)